VILRLGLAVAGLACFACPAEAARARPLIYGSVHYIEEADDTVGIELRLHLGMRPWIDFVLCEGECAPQRRIPITLNPSGFRFDYPEMLTDPDGKQTPNVLHFVATYRGRDLIVGVKDASTEKLRPLRKPIALQ
jgi:hypothetical protein